MCCASSDVIAEDERAPAPQRMPALPASDMQTITPTTCRAQGAPLAPSQPARQRQQRQGVAASSQAGRSLIQKPQHASRSVMAQRRLAARRQAAGSVVAKAGGEALVVGSSGQTAARVVVNLLRAGFKVTAGEQWRAAGGEAAGWGWQGALPAQLLHSCRATCGSSNAPMLPASP